MAKVKNTGFFKQSEQPAAAPETKIQTNEQPAQAAPVPEQPAKPTPAAEQPAQKATAAEQPAHVPSQVKLSSKLLDDVKYAIDKLNGAGFPGLAKEMARLYNIAVNKHFTVAFVGEFSRGKSTLINKMLGRDILPATNLPTTAILTKIAYGPKTKVCVYGRDGKLEREAPLDQHVWDDLTAANFSEEEPEGSVVVQLNDPWLGKYGITLLDTPGAGDLEAKRAQVIERCMVNADGAIIAIDATKPLSLTEQTFIKQKVMSRGVPFMAMALTKLDLVNEQERAGVISYLLKRLDTLKISMPVIITSDNINIPQIETIQGKNLHIGTDKIKSLIIAWMANENRRQLLGRWLSINALEIINSARAFLAQQQAIVDAKDVEKEKLILARTKALSEMRSKWNELRLGMEQRCHKCYEDFTAACHDAGQNIIENLQHEVDRQANPKDWLEKEYSYRVKRELSAVSLSLDNLVAKHLANDIRWLNTELSKQFKAMVGTEVEPLMSREAFKPDVDENALKLESLKDKSVKSTIVTSALTLGAAMLLGVSGGAPLILATMGVGTGAGIISKKLLEKESIKQKEALKQLIAQQMPEIIDNATRDSSTKIKIIYNDVISESYNTEARWMDTQKSMIRSSVQNQGGADLKEQLAKRVETIDTLTKLFAQQS